MSNMSQKLPPTERLWNKRNIGFFILQDGLVPKHRCTLSKKDSRPLSSGPLTSTLSRCTFSQSMVCFALCGGLLGRLHQTQGLETTGQSGGNSYSVIGRKVDSLRTVVKRRTLNKVEGTREVSDHPPHHIQTKRKSCSR